MSPKKPNSYAEHPQFGGQWTLRKLEVLAGYLQSYTTALKNKPTHQKPFRKAFIDAFAGSGYRDVGSLETSQAPLFPDFTSDENQSLLDGSAKLALRTEPAFDRYIFIECSPTRCEQLEELKSEFPDRAEHIDIKQGDANEKIQELCGKQWSSCRAVLFLDPFGMQVEWDTIEAVARTKAIDMWLLFPLGIAVNRLLTTSGEIPKSWQKRLSLLLGTDDWYKEFYTVKTKPNLFGTETEQVVKNANMEKIGNYFNDRLKEIFAGVVEEPGILRNSSNSPLYLMCFAVGNERGKGIALSIAKHLIKELL